jgi:hypothetical protein
VAREVTGPYEANTVLSVKEADQHYRRFLHTEYYSEPGEGPPHGHEGLSRWMAPPTPLCACSKMGSCLVEYWKRTTGLTCLRTEASRGATYLKGCLVMQSLSH